MLSKKIIFKNKSEIKTFLDTKVERVHHYQNCIIRNVKEALSKRKIVSVGNPDLHKGIKSTRNITVWVNMTFSLLFKCFKKIFDCSKGNTNNVL